MSMITENNLVYIINEKENTAGVNKCLEQSKEIFIPKSIQFNGNEYIVTSILDDAFKETTEIKTIKFAHNSELRTIGKQSFYKSKIESFTIPQKVTKIEEKAFCCCKELKNVLINIDSSLEAIEDCAFQGTKIESFTFSHHLIKIGCNAFCSCINLRKIDISNDCEVKYIGKSAFENTALEKFTIPPHLTVLNENVFSRCNKLKEINFSENCELHTIEKYSFYSSPIETIIIPPTLVELKDEWCISISNVTKIKVIDGNTNYKSYDDKFILGKSSPEKENFDVLVFSVRNIEKVTIPDFIEIIGPFAFYDCKKLKEIEISDNSKLRIIEKYAFDQTLIENFTIPRNLEQFNLECFSYNLKNISITPSNKCFKLFENKLILGKSNPNKNNYDKLIFSIPDIERIAIPNSIEIIEPYSFYLHDKLHQVEFTKDSKLQIIKKSAFSGTSIKSIEFPTNLSEIDSNCFNNCKNLIKIKFPINSKLKKD